MSPTERDVRSGEDVHVAHPRDGWQTQLPVGVSSMPVINLFGADTRRELSAPTARWRVLYAAVRECGER